VLLRLWAAAAFEGIIAATGRPSTTVLGSSTREADMSIVHALVTAKRFVADGDAARRRGEDPSRRQAVIAYDVAVEDALMAMADHLGRQAPDFANRPRMVDLVKDKLPSHEAALRLRSDIRNKAMHAGSAPTEEETTLGRQYAVAVLRDAFTAIGHDYDTFTLVPLLENALVREPLEQALQQLAELPPALAFTLAAWRRLEGVVQEAIVATSGAENWFFRAPLWSDLLVISKCADNRAEHALHEVQTAAAQTLTPDQPSVLRLRDLRARLSIERLDDHCEVDVREGQELTRADVAWAIDFVSTVAYQLERANPNLRCAVMAPRGEGPAASLPAIYVDRVTMR
jgi:hypothetical protein